MQNKTKNKQTNKSIFLILYFLEKGSLANFQLVLLLIIIVTVTEHSRQGEPPPSVVANE